MIEVVTILLGMTLATSIFMSGFFLGRIAGRRQMRHWIDTALTE